jgi:hypothetical protein
MTNETYQRISEFAITYNANEDAKEYHARIVDALIKAYKYGSIDGAHHKAWVIDQMSRDLLGENYEKFVEWAKAGDDGPDTYEWDEGIAP